MLPAVMALILLASISLPARPVGQTTTYTPVAGVPCGVVGLTFCEPFDQPTQTLGRAGDLDPTRWTTGRNNPQVVTGVDAWGTLAAPVPACRAARPAVSVFPPFDAQVCDNGQLLTAVAFQNYGLLSLRARQPFDFAGRTGRIVFDMDMPLLGVGATWTSLTITPDPVNGPNDSIYIEHAQVAPTALVLTFNNDTPLCGGGGRNSVRNILTYTNYLETDTPISYGPVCVNVAQGQLNHIEVQLSQSHVDVFASDASTDGGRSFPNFQKIAGADLNLAFTRGYIHLGTHNHATMKYFNLPDGYNTWDNVGFDGPLVPPAREYDVPDALTFSSPGAMNVGYKLRDGMYTCCTSTGQETRVAPVVLSGVDLTNATRARLALLAFYCLGCEASPDLAAYTLQYRFNGGPWRNRTLTPAEAAFLVQPGMDSNLIQLVDVPLGDLRAGDNTLEFATLNTPQGASPPVIGSITLAVETSGAAPPATSTPTRLPTSTPPPTQNPTATLVITPTPSPTRGPCAAQVGVSGDSLRWTPLTDCRQ